ncbi:MAG: FAD binding domain-containing protein [Candidatus Marinimicrobia bacterium]|nr:FAD binding domain-containing protein [Candidatus Neomarinimicrobiota bacterium]
MRHDTHFILNDAEIHTRASGGLLLLDYIRNRARLPGTKEGCREGDCGACTVLVGSPEGGEVNYLPITSCLMPLGEAHGKHVVTIEGLNLPGLSPVQAAIVAEGASQCGFCTPGFVVSLTAMMMSSADVSADEALSGNLCRCTGYRSLKAAARSLSRSVGVEAMTAAGELPGYFSDIPARLSAIPPPAAPADPDSEAQWIAGGTDLYVQKGAAIPGAPVYLLGGREDLTGVTLEGDHLRVGAATTFQAFAGSRDVQAVAPKIEAYMSEIASWPVRNRATLGGNIINASPIADMTILLLALDCSLELEKAGVMRTVALRKFYRGYKQMDLLPGELLRHIIMPLPPSGARLNFEKVAKRTRLDIASVNSAALIMVAGDGRISAAHLSFGGVSPVPLYLTRSSDFLTGKSPSPQLLAELLAMAQDEIAPISDIRGSADYKRLLVRQLLISHFLTLLPDALAVEEIYAAH